MRRQLVAIPALVLLLSACGSADDDPVGSSDVVTDPSAGGAAGTCLEGTPDCVDADLSGDEAPAEPDATFDAEAARRDARSLLGEPEDEVLELWGDVRVGRHGDEQMMLTEDWQPGRKTIATEDDGTGTYRVVEVVLELDEGTETFTTEDG